jgi:hypothetical protein
MPAADHPPAPDVVRKSLAVQRSTTFVTAANAQNTTTSSGGACQRVDNANPMA